MATSRVCTDTVTIFNRTGTDEGRRDVYQASVLEHVHTLATEGVIASAQVAEDAMKLLIFDDALSVPSGRTFLECRSFFLLEDSAKADYWTLTPDGRDYVCLGQAAADADGHLPEDATLYAIRKVMRHPKGSRGMRHWTVEAV